MKIKAHLNNSDELFHQKILFSDANFRKSATSGMESNEEIKPARTFQKYRKTLVLSLSFISALALVSCNTSAEKVENAELNLISAEQELEEANADYLMDVEKYRSDTKERIDANNVKIEEYKLENEKRKKDAKEEYRAQIALLEQRNADLKIRLDTYEPDSRDNWEKFKSDFGSDMNELGTAIKNLFD